MNNLRDKTKRVLRRKQFVTVEKKKTTTLRQRTKPTIATKCLPITTTTTGQTKKLGRPKKKRPSIMTRPKKTIIPVNDTNMDETIPKIENIEITSIVATPATNTNEIPIDDDDKNSKNNAGSQSDVTLESNNNNNFNNITKIEQPDKDTNANNGTNKAAIDSMDQKSQSSEFNQNKENAADDSNDISETVLDGCEIVMPRPIEIIKIESNGDSVMKELPIIQVDVPEEVAVIKETESEVSKDDNSMLESIIPSVQQQQQQQPVQESQPPLPPPPVHVPKKRGRKPGTKLKPKIDQFIKSSGLNLKRSLRLSKDSMSDSILATAVARREKLDDPNVTTTTTITTTTTTTTLPQRLSRRIKPTAKILANDELRYGFELQNNARLNVGCIVEHREKTPENINIMKLPLILPSLASQSIPIEDQKPSEIINNGGGGDDDDHSPADNYSHHLKTPPPPPPASASASRRPCPDPIEFLNEIKMAKINLHRSPEDNKKLNLKQKRRLFKLKEKHLNKLGLQKTNKTFNDLSGASSESDLDDLDEFVPNKKISVGRPSVTLRVRNNRDEDQHGNRKHDAQSKKEKLRQSKSATTTTTTANDCPKLTRSIQKTLLHEMRQKRAATLKITTIQSPALVQKLCDSATNQSASLVKHEIIHSTICLCNAISKYFTRKTSQTTYCHAVDEIGANTVGCRNEISDELPNLLRPSVRVSYMILCNDHRQRLRAHNCCAGCGIFCTQGRFVVCKSNHLFHRNCAAKFILNSPYNQSTTSTSTSSQSLAVNAFTYPTLVLRCPHCGCDAPEFESFVQMECGSAPVFVPNQQQSNGTKTMRMAKMSIDLKNIRRISMEDHFVMQLEKVVPDEIFEMVANAQNNYPFCSRPVFTTKDLFYATYRNDVDRMVEIIATGFDITVSIPEYQNRTCLHLISNSGNINMAHLILSRVTTLDFLNAVDNELNSAVMCAVVSNCNEILQLLVQCGADVTLKGTDGMTALHMAAKNGNFPAIKILLETYRCSVNAQRFEQYLNQTDDGGWTAMVWAAELGHSALVQYFIQNGADKMICDNENNNVLHWAIMSDDLDTIVPLLQDDCDFNAQNVNGDTPLHIACRNANTNVCLMLLMRGASLDLKNAAGDRPYDCIPNENSPCARAIAFNMAVRKFSTNGTNQIVCQDISNGREYYPIKVVKRSANAQSCDGIVAEFDYSSLPDFKYITKTILLQNSIQIDQRISQMRICSCSDNCTSRSCQCSEISVQNWYMADGRLTGNFNYRDPAMIFECNDVCGCNKLLCKNRVVQNGTKCPMQIIECATKSKGWGVIGITKILKGTFVAEYTGEILTDSEADRRTDDSYFFDLGASDHCIDANYYGNVSRFFNHSCDPNIVPIRVYFEHQDLRFPKIAFFACRDIDVGEEITFDYGEKFWLIKYKSFTCLCGVSECRFSNQTIEKTLDEYNQRLNKPSN